MQVVVPEIEDCEFDDGQDSSGRVVFVRSGIVVLMQQILRMPETVVILS